MPPSLRTRRQRDAGASEAKVSREGSSARSEGVFAEPATHAAAAAEEEAEGEEWEFCGRNLRRRRVRRRLAAVDAVMATVPELVAGGNSLVHMTARLVAKQPISRALRQWTAAREVSVGRLLNAAGCGGASSGYGLFLPSDLPAPMRPRVSEAAAAMADPSPILVVMDRQSGKHTLDLLPAEVYHAMRTCGGLVVRAARSCLVALADVHAAGVLHGDLKPDNLLLAPSCDRACLLDFGNASALPLVEPAEVVAPAFETSPLAFQDPSFLASRELGEGWGRGMVTLRSDVYQLGVSLAWLTVRVAWGGEAANDFLRRHNEPAPSVRLFLGDRIVGAGRAGWEWLIGSYSRRAPYLPGWIARGGVSPSARSEWVRGWADGTPSGLSTRSRFCEAPANVSGLPERPMEEEEGDDEGPLASLPPLLRTVASALRSMRPLWSERLRRGLMQLITELLHPLWWCRPTADGVLADMDVRFGGVALVSGTGERQQVAVRARDLEVRPIRFPTPLLGRLICAWRAELRSTAQGQNNGSPVICVLALALFVRCPSLSEPAALLLAIMLSRGPVPPLATDAEVELARAVAEEGPRIASSMRAASVAETEVLRRGGCLAATVDTFMAALENRMLAAAACTDGMLARPMSESVSVALGAKVSAAHWNPPKSRPAANS
jgi:serine/threonine protein kinase